MGFCPGGTAAGAFVEGDQLATLHIKLFVLFHDPFVESIAAERLALVLFFQGRFFKFNDFTQSCDLCLICCEFLL